MAQAQDKLEGHVIVCGFGVVGQKVVEVLEEHGIPFVIIEIMPQVVEHIRELDYRVIAGDATASRVLRMASIATAKAIAIVMDNDAKNLFAVLTARDLNKNIFIATRANDAMVREKMLEALVRNIATPQKSASEEIFGEITK
ncbi:NAD-binding protein [Candidatus Marsarchaeota archaeon]|nr:NAD-binding protein [Candidatus Marsarchaeota archaeon]